MTLGMCLPQPVHAVFSAVVAKDYRDPSLRRAVGRKGPFLGPILLGHAVIQLYRPYTVSTRFHPSLSGILTFHPSHSDSSCQSAFKCNYISKELTFLGIKDAVCYSIYFTFQLHI
jgi:hypothetical protein